MKPIVYMHFAYKKPKNEDGKAIFALAIYKDRNYNELLIKDVKYLPVWVEDQNAIAIQSYVNALEYIFENQGRMSKLGIKNILLVTSNSLLINWLTKDGRNRYYRDMAIRESKQYRFGQKKGIELGVGLMGAGEKDKVKKFCHMKFVENLEPLESTKNSSNNKEFVFDGIDTLSKDGMQNIFDILNTYEPENLGDKCEELN